MKPTALYPGQRVLIVPSLGLKKPYHGTFIQRVPREQGRPAYSLFSVDEFVGLRDSDDRGHITCSDYYVARNVQPLEARA